MPRSTAEITSDFAETTTNPTQTIAVPPGSSRGLTVTVEIVYQIPFVPANLLNALKTQYGATKVVSERDKMARNIYNFRIIP